MKTLLFLLVFVSSFGQNRIYFDFMWKVRTETNGNVFRPIVTISKNKIKRTESDCFYLDSISVKIPNGATHFTIEFKYNEAIDTPIIVDSIHHNTKGNYLYSITELMGNDYKTNYDYHRDIYPDTDTNEDRMVMWGIDYYYNIKFIKIENEFNTLKYINYPNKRINNKFVYVSYDSKFNKTIQTFGDDNLVKKHLGVCYYDNNTIVHDNKKYEFGIISEVKSQKKSQYYNYIRDEIKKINGNIDYIMSKYENQIKDFRIKDLYYIKLYDNKSEYKLPSVDLIKSLK